MKRIKIKGTTLMFSILTQAECQAHDIPTNDVFLHSNLRFYGLCYQDLLTIFDIGSFDWSKPQEWVDERTKYNKDFEPGNFVWAYPKGGPSEGLPWDYGRLWSILAKYIIEYMIENKPENWHIINENFQIIEIERIPYNLYPKEA
jgi:hypothetical protein